MKLKRLTDCEQTDVRLEGARRVRMRLLIGPSDGATKFHMRHFEVAPGGHTPHHAHDYEHEILILKGSGTVRSEKGEQACQPGDVIWMPPNERHQFRNTGAEPLEFLCLIPAPQACAWQGRNGGGLCR